MRLSVLMSVYHKDKPQYLQQALESIWDDQLLKPDEIVLVEDGILTPELYNVLNNWSSKIESILKRLVLEENYGLTVALNRGIELCSGEYIARMDSDDVSLPDRFFIQTDYLCKNKDIMVVGSAIQEFSIQSNLGNIRKYPENTELALKYIVKACPFAHPTVMFRRQVFDSGIRYSEKFKTSQDIDLWYRVLRVGYKVANLHDVLLHFRVSDNFFERRSKEKAFNEFKIYWHGIISMHGYSWKLSYPILRLLFRLAPKPIVKKIYSGRIRTRLNN